MTKEDKICAFVTAQKNPVLVDVIHQLYGQDVKSVATTRTQVKRLAQSGRIGYMDTALVGGWFAFAGKPIMTGKGIAFSLKHPLCKQVTKQWLKSWVAKHEKDFTPTGRLSKNCKKRVTSESRKDAYKKRKKRS